MAKTKEELEIERKEEAAHQYMLKCLREDVSKMNERDSAITNSFTKEEDYLTNLFIDEYSFNFYNNEGEDVDYE